MCNCHLFFIKCQRKWDEMLIKAINMAGGHAFLNLSSPEYNHWNCHKLPHKVSRKCRAFCMSFQYWQSTWFFVSVCDSFTSTLFLPQFNIYRIKVENLPNFPFLRNYWHSCLRSITLCRWGRPIFFFPCLFACAGRQRPYPLCNALIECLI